MNKLIDGLCIGVILTIAFAGVVWTGWRALDSVETPQPVEVYPFRPADNPGPEAPRFWLLEHRRRIDRF